MSRARHLLLLGSALVPLLAAGASAGPQGPSVVGGSATVQNPGSANVVVNQSSQRAVINWHMFNIGAGETTTFNTPGASAVTLNRVTGGMGPSQILGTLNSNGQVFIVNRDGFVFGAGAVVNTAGFLATTHDIKNEDFMAGRYHFNIPGRPDASIVNHGTITAHSGGFAALVAPGVRNTGTITATLGTVGLAASGNGFELALDPYGDKLIKLGVSDQIAGQVIDVSTGQPLSSLVTNTGKLSANGGRVELTAAAARHVVDSVINTSGVIEANTVGTKGGQIILGAATGASKPAGAPKQTVRVSGKLSVAGKQSGQKGGNVVITGEDIQVAGATIDASGAAGGGKVLIGGDTGGGQQIAALTHPGAQLEGVTIPTATTVSIDAATTITASATESGNGGKVVLWADSQLTFAGMIAAYGAGSGRGGFIETSAKHHISVGGTIAAGPGGLWLLDPDDLLIDSSLAATIMATLNGGTDVVHMTTSAGLVDNQDIIVDANITWTGNASLTLSAYRNVQINDNVTITHSGGTGSLNLRADNEGTGTGTIIFNQWTMGARVDFTNSNGKVNFYYNPANYATPTDYTPAGQGGGSRGVTTNISVPNQFTAYMLVNDETDLGNISTNLAGTYALGKSFAGSGSFLPIGLVGGPFTGIFDGQNHVISNLTISANTSTDTNIGLFAEIGASGVVRNLGLANITVNANPAAFGTQYLGILAGRNSGSISYVSSSGSVSSGAMGQIVAGGLVGWNQGTLANTQSAAAVTLNAGGTAGGLVGRNQFGGTVTASHATGNLTVGDSGAADIFAGGLVGDNYGSIASSYATGTVTGNGGDTYLGGLVGVHDFYGTITNSYATGNVALTATTMGWVGGLIGGSEGSVTGSHATGNVTLNSTAGGYAGGLAGVSYGAFTNTYATGTVGGANGNAFVGGLVGMLDSSGSIDDSHATGAVAFTTTGLGYVGGLVGDNAGTITDSHATGNVSLTNTAAGQVGGLVGYSDGSITNAYATGAVSGDAFVAGGLVGWNDGMLSTTHATGAVSGTSVTMGGLVGVNENTIYNSHATGNVSSTGGSSAGGFVGLNLSGSIESSYATGNVSITNGIAGGFAAWNTASIETSHSSGAVTGDANSLLGGFVGFNFQGSIYQSYSTSAVTGGVASGGFAGVNAGGITQAFATGTVTVGDYAYAGGFVALNYSYTGPNDGNINQAYATGAVTTGMNGVAGGFAAQNGGALDQTYAAGLVTSGAGSYTGGLVALNGYGIPSGYTPPLTPGATPGTATNSYWDIGTTGQSASQGGTGLTTAQLTSALPAGFTSPAWDINAGTSYPFFNPLSNPIPTPGPQAPPPPPHTHDPGCGGHGQDACAPPPQPPVILVSNDPVPQQPQDIITIVPPAPPAPPSGNQPPPRRVSGVPPRGETRFVSNEVVLQLGNNVSPEQLAAVARELGLEVIASENVGLLARTVYRFRITNGSSVADVIRALEAKNITAFAQPNYVYTLTQAAETSAQETAAISSTHGDSEQYTISKLRLQETHSLARGSNVLVAVIDSAIDPNHPDLKDAIADRLNTVDGEVKPHTHGTGMAGAIASQRRLLGVAPRSRLLAISAFGPKAQTAESTSMQIVKGLNWAVEKGAKVINMSFAGPHDPILAQAIKTMHDRGIVMVAAAGNAGPGSPPLFPAADPNVIAVTATDIQDKVFARANRGKHIAIAAPGVDVLVPAPEGSYQLTTGTSVAAAHISGVAALLLERNPTLKPSDIRKLLTGTARKNAGTRPEDIGSGLVDPYQALQRSGRSAAVR